MDIILVFLLTGKNVLTVQVKPYFDSHTQHTNEAY